MKNMNFFVLVFGISLLLLAAGCTQVAEEKQGKAALSVKYFDKDGALVLDKSFEAEKGKNAFEAMSENIEVDYEMYETGAFVKGIAGVKTPEGYYLALYVNGEYASKGISDYTIDEDMSIEWKTKSIESFGS